MAKERESGADVTRDTVQLFGWIPGRATADPRHRCTCIGGKARTYKFLSNPQKAWVHACQDWAKKQVASELRDGPHAGDVVIHLRFLMERPAKHYTGNNRARPLKDRSVDLPYLKKPDFDNLAKAATDAWNGILWVDDSQVVEALIQKRYVAADEQPGLQVDIWMGTDRQMTFVPCIDSMR